MPAEAGIRGGALHDALIAATAAHHGHTPASTDRRTARAHAAVGVATHVHDELELTGAERAH